MNSLHAELNYMSSEAATIVMFGPSVVRFGPKEGEYSLMNRQDRGWSCTSYTYDSLHELFLDWRLKITGEGEDKHGKYLTVEPVPKKVRFLPR